MILIDGSQGEGGGQILRTSLALSMLTGTPFRIEKIRANRAKPGLMRQHLTAVNAAAVICSALWSKVAGASIGSRRIDLAPGAREGWELHLFRWVGRQHDAGVADGVAAADVGGWAFVVDAGRGDAQHSCAAAGFSGEGVFADRQSDGAEGFDLAGAGGFLSRGRRAVCGDNSVGEKTRGDRYSPARSHHASAGQGGLPRRCRARSAACELDEVRRGLGWPDESLQIRANFPRGRVREISLRSRSAREQVTEVFTGFGQRGVTAEAVAQHALTEAKDYLASGAPVGNHLADQLILPLALAGGGSP